MCAHTTQHANIQASELSFKAEGHAVALADPRFPYARMPMNFFHLQARITPVPVEQLNRSSNLMLMYFRQRLKVFPEPICPLNIEQRSLAYFLDLSAAMAAFAPL